MDPGRARPGDARAGHPGGAKPDSPHPAQGGRALAASAYLGTEHRPRLRPKRARIVALYTATPEGATVVCVDQLGPVTPRTFPPTPGWSADGHHLKAPLDYSRGPDKVWVYGALRPQDGQAYTFTAPSRNTAGFLRLPGDLGVAHPAGDLYPINDNLSSHASGPIREWLAAHPRVRQVALPTGACWLNLIEGWWRLLRRAAFAGQSFADHTDIQQATTLATRQLNRRARPWRWGRPPPQHPRLRRAFVYRL